MAGKSTGARLPAAAAESRPSAERAAVGTPSGRLVIGVVALQGGFAAHAKVLRSLGAEVREVRTPEDLDGLDGLVRICRG